MRRTLLAVLLLAAIAAGGLAVVRGDSSSGEDEVPTIPVVRGPFHASVRASGELKSKGTVTVSAGRVPGALVVSWLAPEGSQVAPGDVVVEFESQEAREQLQQADAEVRKIEEEIAKHAIQVKAAHTDLEAEATRTRISRERASFKAQLDEGIVPQIELDEAKMDLRLAEMDLGRVQRSLAAQSPKDEAALALLEIRLEKARNQRNLAQTTLDATRAVAPAPGVVAYQTIWKQGGRGKVAPGDRIWPGRGVLDIVDLEQLEFVAQVREEDAVKVAVEQPATVRLPALPGVALTGTVSQVAAVAEQADMTSPLKFVRVTIALDSDDPALRAGLTGVAEILTVAAEDVITVPREALVHDGDISFVYVPAEAGPERRRVELGDEGDALVVVTSGLAGGELVYARDPTRSKEEIEAERRERQKEARKKRKSSGSTGGVRIIRF